MDNRIRFTVAGAALLLAAAPAFAYPSGSRIPAGNAGEPGTGTPCASCHRVTLNPTGGSATLSVPDTLAYEPGVKQPFTLRVADTDSSRRFGFQLAATAGTLASPQGVTITSGGALIALSSEFTEPWLGRLAAPNTTIALIASGLRADTDPARFQITIGAETATILGLEGAQPGLTRILIKLPNLETGEHTIKLAVDSTAAQIEPLLPVQR